jgi:GNAT superfamily N-acetyltransferase
MADTGSNIEVRIDEISSEEDIGPVFEVCAKAFGEQTADGIWTAMNPGWNTADGKTQGAARMASWWRYTKLDGHTHFIKASVGERIVGIAIWVNASLLPGHGEQPDHLDYEKLHPNDTRTATFLSQIFESLHKLRHQVLQEKARPGSAQKSVMILDLCAVDPAYQRRGIASKLVQWGLDEARRLGDLEAITEASVMGRSIYTRLGFREVAEIEYEIDEEFKTRSQPSNVFLRTRPE